MELNNNNKSVTSITQTKKITSPISDIVHITKNMCGLMQRSSDSENEHEGTNDYPALDEINRSSDDDGENSTPPHKQSRIHLRITSRSAKRSHNDFNQ